ncbi:MAG: hypothetical protein J6Q35_02165 [Rikenellaceae bacterium]|nr:hypothetical protein [Rikenellaceae bacterium]
MKKLLKLAIASMMIIGAISASAQDDKNKTAGQKYIEECARDFDNMSLVRPDGSISAGCAGIERIIIRRGESTRYKKLFEAGKRAKIEIKGVKSATEEELRKGEFIATLKPEKTTTYEIIETIYGGSIQGVPRYYDIDFKFTIVVVEAEKYDSIIELRSHMNSQQKSIHFRELMGEWVNPFEKAEINKMAKMTPEERAAYKKKLEKKFGGKRK